MARLDQELEARNYQKLGELMLHPTNRSDMAAALDWGQSRTLQGKSVVVPLGYARLLWLAGSLPNSSVRYKNTAGAMVAYSLLVIEADGVKCADPSAPDKRFNDVLRNDRVMLATMARLPHVATPAAPDTRDEATSVALATERRTLALRGDDDYLCRGGLQEIGEYLQKHGQQGLTERPAEPGEVGKQMVVPTDPDYVPKFLSRDQWQPKQDAIRAKFTTLLPQLLDKAATSPS